MYQFLMGLNETYAQAKSQILLMTPLPLVNRAYSMIASDENQKQVAQNVSIVGLLGMAPVCLRLQQCTLELDHKKG